MPVRLRSVNWTDLKRMLAQSPGYQRYLEQRLNAAQGYAESISPRDARAGGVHYADSFMVEIARFSDGVPVGHLKNTSPIWAVVEKGSANQRRPQGGWSNGQHVLSRTLHWLHTT